MPKILSMSTIKMEPSGQEYELKDAKARQDLLVMGDDIANFDLELDAIKKSVSDGKILLADAITRKAIQTEPTDNLTDMAKNILKIRSEIGYSGAYYNNVKLYYLDDTGDNRVYNGFPYVYGQELEENEIVVIADYEWQDSNDWHLIGQFHNMGTSTSWFSGKRLMGFFSEETGLVLEVYTNSRDIYLKCFTEDSPETFIKYKASPEVVETITNFTDVLLDLHYTYDTVKKAGYMTLSYADASKEILEWTLILSTPITLSSNSFGAPAFLINTGNHTAVHVGECALVLDGYINWGNSSVYQFRDGEIPYNLSGWHRIGGVWYYYVDGKKVIKKGWQEIRGNWYYFNAFGEMQTGWLTWENKKYYFDENGIMQTGWLEYEGNKYYFIPSGRMAKGWLDIGADRYYFGTDGIMQSSIWIDNNYWLGEDGKMARNAWVTASTNTFYVGANGARVIGWQDIGEDRYFFNTGGVMQKSRWIESTYWVKADGKMARDEWVDGDKYYVGPDGKWVKDAVKE